MVFVLISCDWAILQIYRQLLLAPAISDLATIDQSDKAFHQVPLAGSNVYRSPSIVIANETKPGPELN